MSEGARCGDDWLCEAGQGMCLCLGVRRWLVRRRTSYQKLALAETEEHGRVLALNGRFMLSERDEFFYHEMLVHPVLLSLPQPERVLVVGGGDGGALREVLRHPVREAVLVEIDEEVIQAAREHLESVHQGAFSDSRARIVVAPGQDFVAQEKARFDAIIVDSTDPVGPGAALFEPSFLRSCRRALRKGGGLALQAGSPFYQTSQVVNLLTVLRPLFPTVLPYLGFVPIYPSGMWAYVLALDRESHPTQEELAARYAQRGLKTRYYSPSVHQAALTLPPFFAQEVSRCLSASPS